MQKIVALGLAFKALPQLARAGIEGDLENLTKDLNTPSSDQDNELNNNLINNKHFLEMNTRLEKLESITIKLLNLIESQLTKGV